MCDCGKKTIVHTGSLMAKATTSCGCYKQEIFKKNKSSGLRAGKRKCKRCREIFINEKNKQLFFICERCREHCKRCDVKLDASNYSFKQNKFNKYQCNKCLSEIVKNKYDKKRQKEYDLLRNYGVTINEYEKLLEVENGGCWICKKLPAKNSLAVDHKHETGEKKRSVRRIRFKVRGLLCWPCNAAIGKFKDDPKLLRNAAIYLETNFAQKILNNSDFYEIKSDHIGRDGSIIIRQKPEPFDVMDYDDNLGKQ